MNTKTRNVFETQVKLIRQRLRQIAPDLMLELESTELALHNLAPDPDATEYTGYRLAIEAIEAYLDKYNRPAKGIVIATALANGGWLAKDDRAVTNVLDSIRYHLKRPTKRLKAFAGDAMDPANAMIARYDWEAPGDKAMRFSLIPIADAIRMALGETGHALTQENLTHVLFEGGAARGSKRGKHNIRISIEMTLMSGKLKQVGELLGLPEWDESMFRERE